MPVSRRGRVPLSPCRSPALACRPFAPLGFPASPASSKGTRPRPPGHGVPPPFPASNRRSRRPTSVSCRNSKSSAGDASPRRPGRHLGLGRAKPGAAQDASGEADERSVRPSTSLLSPPLDTSPPSSPQRKSRSRFRRAHRGRGRGRRGLRSASGDRRVLGGGGNSRRCSSDRRSSDPRGCAGPRTAIAARPGAPGLRRTRSGPRGRELGFGGLRLQGIGPMSTAPP